MKVVKFLGGLGNQMFQYAFYKALEQEFRRVKADLSGFADYTLHNGFELERVFNLKLAQVSPMQINLMDNRNRAWKYRKMRRLLFIKTADYYEEENLFTYEDALFHDSSSKIYWGYWQHYRYVARVADQLRKDFAFPIIEPSKNLDVLQEFEHEPESVAIHIRRGDYLKDPYLGGLATLEYFQQGISFMKSRLKQPKFYVFSDDIPWCKQYLDLNHATFIDWNKSADSFRDMQLISHCKHAILSNSSFSWWGAWLNSNPDKIIVVPKVWCKGSNILDTKQMHPDEWIKI